MCYQNVPSQGEFFNTEDTAWFGHRFPCAAQAFTSMGTCSGIGIGIATIYGLLKSGMQIMLPVDHYLMLLAIAVVLAIDAVALFLYLRHKP